MIADPTVTGDHANEGTNAITRSALPKAIRDVFENRLKIFEGKEDGEQWLQSIKIWMNFSGQSIISCMQTFLDGPVRKIL